jgi:hypothetical protein
MWILLYQEFGDFPQKAVGDEAFIPGIELSVEMLRKHVEVIFF